MTLPNQPPSMAALDSACALLVQAGYKEDSSTLFRLAIARSLTLELMDAFLEFLIDSSFADDPKMEWFCTNADVSKLARAFGFKDLEDAINAAYSE